MEHIPKFFWYCVSIAMLATTCVVLLLAWRSSSLSIEFADAKISIQQVAGSVQNLNYLRSNTVESAKRIETQWRTKDISDEEAVTSLVSLIEGYGSETERQNQEIIQRLETTVDTVERITTMPALF